MTREQAINYLRSSGFSEEQIQEIVKALEQGPVIESAYKTGYELGRLTGMADSVRDRV